MSFKGLIAAAALLLLFGAPDSFIQNREAEVPVRMYAEAVAEEPEVKPDSAEECSSPAWAETEAEPAPFTIVWASDTQDMVLHYRRKTSHSQKVQLDRRKRRTKASCRICAYGRHSGYGGTLTAVEVFLAGRAEDRKRDSSVHDRRQSRLHVRKITVERAVFRQGDTEKTELSAGTIASIIKE